MLTSLSNLNVHTFGISYVTTTLYSSHTHKSLPHHSLKEWVFNTFEVIKIKTNHLLITITHLLLPKIHLYMQSFFPFTSTLPIPSITILYPPKLYTSFPAYLGPIFYHHQSMLKPSLINLLTYWFYYITLSSPFVGWTVQQGKCFPVSHTFILQFYPRRLPYTKSCNV